MYRFTTPPEHSGRRGRLAELRQARCHAIPNARGCCRTQSLRPGCGSTAAVHTSASPTSPPFPVAASIASCCGLHRCDHSLLLRIHALITRRTTTATCQRRSPVKSPATLARAPPSRRPARAPSPDTAVCLLANHTIGPQPTMPLLLPFCQLV